MENLKTLFVENLKDLYTHKEAGDLYRLFVAEVCQCPLSATYFRKDTDFTDLQKEKMLSVLQRLCQGEPYQYVMGYADMGGMRFRVGPGVLIPRPETVQLAQWILDEEHLEVGSRLLDVGTGSGLLAILLGSRLPQCHITAMDISQVALQTAAQNAQDNGVKLALWQQDMLSPQWSCDAPYRLIVSNPPYVMEAEKTTMEKVVLDYEPASALFVPDNDPLLFYKAVAHFAKQALTQDGSLYFEINPLCYKQLECYLQSLGFSTTLQRDIEGRWRMLKAWF